MLEDFKIQDAIFSSENSESEVKLRPNTIDDFLGQNSLKENLLIFIKAAKDREESLDHVFLSGPPGLGKTTLASIIANEMAAPIKLTSAPALEKPKDIVGILTNLEKGSLLFIDEIHRLKPVIEEMLYIAMEDFEIDWVIGQGPAARSIRIPLPRFTLIGATTKPGKVSSPLHTRFGIIGRLDLYEERDLLKIIKRSAKILEIEIEENAAFRLASSSRGTPRVANRLLRRIRDIAQVKKLSIIREDIVIEGLEKLKIDSKGLDEQDRNILKTIIVNFNGGPVGLDTLAVSLSETSDSLEDFYEPFLIQRGLLERTNRGRKATALAYKHLNLMKGSEFENQGILF